MILKSELYAKNIFLKIGILTISGLRAILVKLIGG